MEKIETPQRYETPNTIATATIIFIVLKLTGVVPWSWIWVLCPAWLYVILLLADVIYRVVRQNVSWKEAENLLDDLEKLPNMIDRNGRSLTKGDVFQFDGKAWQFLGNSPLGGPDDVNDMREAIAKTECSGHCGLNYCDENGCLHRKRNYVDGTGLATPNFTDAKPKHADEAPEGFTGGGPYMRMDYKIDPASLPPQS